MFEPRKLIPLSMEDCSAPIAVMTEITEKTPMVMPIIVRAARSLFAPSEASAIFTISLKSILVYRRERRSVVKLLIPQRGHWIEAGSGPRRGETGEQAG